MPTMREEVNYIVVADTMPDHIKIADLSDGAFRSLIELWCYCHRMNTDGWVPRRIWNTHRKGVRDELVKGHLVEPKGNDAEPVYMHDYLDMQRSAAEVERTKERRAEGGRLGNHMRHHVNRGVTRPSCSFCRKGVIV